MPDGTFDENDLRAAIVATWGEHGAHIEVFDHMDKLAQKYLQLLRDTERMVRKAKGYEG